MRINNTLPGINSKRSLTTDAKKQNKNRKDLQSGKTVDKAGDNTSKLSLSGKVKTQISQESTGANKATTNIMIQNEKMAGETMQATKEDILTQPDMALQSQANQASQKALQLLAI